MKSFAVLSSLAISAPLVSAFPSAVYEHLAAKRAAAVPGTEQGAGALPLAPPPFDPVAQRIDVSGKYAFKAPGPLDQRGECPGLNAMANHGYLPHNGIATIQQFTDATQQVFGMSPDLGGFLALYGALIDGTGTSWSIGGVPHTGILGSHNNYEADSSPLKSDLNQYGSNEKLIISQFKTLYDMQPDAATANYNLEVLRDFRGKRFQESVDKNPLFSYLPFGGILVSQAAFTFIYRFMANKTAEYPEGILNKNTLKSFMSITGPDSNPVWTHGYERIPENWYKRNAADEYSVEYFLADILYFAETQPEILSIGCNKNAVDTYSPLDPATLTGGVYDAQSILKNPVCFATEFALAEVPLLTGLSSSVLKPLIQPIVDLLSPMGCANIPAINQTALSACPGLSLYGGPTGPVAQGAIQS